MPFNFPIAQNRFGDLFSQGISEALGQYYQGKQLQRQGRFDTRALAQQDQGLAMERANAARQGIHFDQPGAVVPNEPLAPRVDVPTSASAIPSFQDTISQAMNGVPNAKMPVAPTPNERADQGDFQLPERTFFQGGYINNREGMIPMLLAATMKAREAGMVKGAEKGAEEPFAVSAFQRGLQGDVFKSGLDVQKERTLAGDRASALTGATLPGGAPISAQNANAVANNPGVAGSLFRPAANVPLSPDWFKAKQFESDLAQQRTLNLLAPKTADALTRKQGEQNITPLNAQENAATIQLPRIAEAASFLQQHGTPGAIAELTRHGTFKNYLNSPEGRQLIQASMQLALSSALATEGPRGAQPDRVEYFRNTFVPKAGDDPETVQRKLGQLQGLARSVKTASGRGYSRMDPSQQAQVESYLNGGQPQAGIASKYGIKPSAP